MKNKKQLKWVYCRRCKIVSPICPICGNNMCAADTGVVNGKRCETCMKIYDIWGNLGELDLVPNAKGLPRIEDGTNYIYTYPFKAHWKSRICNFFFDLFHNPEKRHKENV
jgi:hypothetical protein